MDKHADKKNSNSQISPLTDSYKLRIFEEMIAEAERFAAEDKKNCSPVGAAASALLASFKETIKAAEEITMEAKESQDWFSLPKLLASGVAFDFEQLEGRKATIKHCALKGQLEGKLTRLSYGEVDKPRGWSITLEGPADAASGVFHESWYGDWGWELLVEGPIPHPTADILKPGFTFVGRCMGEERDCIVTSLGSIENQETGEVLEQKVVTGVTLRNPKENSETGPVNWVPKQVEVLRIYHSYGRFEG